MSSNYSNQKMITMDVYKIMKQLNIDEKAFTFQNPPPSYTKSQLPSDDDSK